MESDLLCCDLCFEEFDRGERLPKVLPCGHTVCLGCLQGLLDSPAKLLNGMQCPTCRREFKVSPQRAPTNFTVLQLAECARQPPRRTSALHNNWCSDCSAAAGQRCWGDHHHVVTLKRALCSSLQGVLPQAAVLLDGLRDQCQGERALQALTLLAGESWDLTLRGPGEGHEVSLTGTLRNTEDPLVKAMWLIVAARAALTEDRRTSPSAEPQPQSQGLPTLDLDDISRAVSSGPDSDQQKDAVLRSTPGVRQLVNLFCHRDPAWSLQMLWCAASTVEHLSVFFPREEHVGAVHAMPRLRMLDVTFDDCLELEDAQPPVLVTALPPGHSGLQWLSVWGYPPRATLRSLLQAHGHTLEELRLWVGTAGKEEEWPWGCSDLHSLLQQCGLRALRRLVLLRRRWALCRHRAADCHQQRAEVRRVLPWAEVLCDTCDLVEKELTRLGL